MSGQTGPAYFHFNGRRTCSGKLPKDVPMLLPLLVGERTDIRGVSRRLVTSPSDATAPAATVDHPLVALGTVVLA